jgi:hypothetical protein
MSRTTITLPEELVDELDAHRPDDMPRPEFFREVVLPALAGEHVEIVVDGALEEGVLERLDELEGRIDDVASSLPAETAEQLQQMLR